MRSQKRVRADLDIDRAVANEKRCRAVLAGLGGEKAKEEHAVEMTKLDSADELTAAERAASAQATEKTGANSQRTKEAAENTKDNGSNATTKALSNTLIDFLSRVMRRDRKGILRQGLNYYIY